MMSYDLIKISPIVDQTHLLQWLGVGFAFTHDAVSSITDTANGDGWLGRVVADGNNYWIGNYIDSYLMLSFGGIPWQVIIKFGASFIGQ